MRLIAFLLAIAGMAAFSTYRRAYGGAGVAAVGASLLALEQSDDATVAPVLWVMMLTAGGLVVTFVRSARA